MANMYQDKELIEKILSGNENLFSNLIKTYEKMVWVLVFRIIQDEDETKDICQEIFIKVYLNLEKFNFDSKLSTWIATIAYREALNFLKKRKKIDYASITDEHFQMQTSDESKQYLQEKEVQILVESMIEKLPLQYRTIITLYHLHEFSYKEIADVTKLPEGTVKSYLFRARKLMKDQFSKNFILQHLKE